MRDRADDHVDVDLDALGEPARRAWSWSEKPTSTAARPTKLCSSATSSGICVMPTRSAIDRADHARRRAIATEQRAGCVDDSRGHASSVAPIAIAMPTMPYRLPRRAVSWLDSPRSARMNSTPATRYATLTSAIEWVNAMPIVTS